MFHPDYYKNPFLLPDDWEQAQFFFLRQMAKLYECLSESRRLDLSHKDFMTLLGNKVQSGFSQFDNPGKMINAFNKVIHDYDEAGILALKINMVTTSLERFRSDAQARVIRLNNEFYMALQKVRINDLASLLPQACAFYVSFEKPITFSSVALSVKFQERANNFDDQVVGGYVVYSPAADDRPGEVVIQLINSDKSTSMGRMSVGLIVPLVRPSFEESFVETAKGHQLSPLVKEIDKEIQEKVLAGVHSQLESITGLVNACAYYYSLEPDVRHLAPAKEQKEKKKLAKTYGVPEEYVSSYYPVTLLNWAYGRDRVYSVDKTWVDSYLRWQRCGPGLSQTKLIMVKEHERHYKKEGEVHASHV